MKKILLPGIAVTFILTVVAFGANPGWWSDSTNGTLFIDSNSTINNYAPLNIGQLKNMASKASTYLNNQLSLVGGAGANVTTMVGNFTTNGTLNYQAANLGQLKAVAKPIYDRLIAVGYNTTLNLQNQGYANTWTGVYPWDPSTPTSQNYVQANLGQAKMVFSFDLTNFTVSANLDANSDSYRDAWEIHYFSTPLVTLTSTSGNTTGDDVPYYEDANPATHTAGNLTVTISYPASNSTL